MDNGGYDLPALLDILIPISLSPGIRHQVFLVRIFRESDLVSRARCQSSLHLMQPLQKRVFARYWDGVHDQCDISGTSRFISGGIGGITSQLSIYPIETLKTQLQSGVGAAKGKLKRTAVHMWQQGEVRAYYRGLTVSWSWWREWRECRSGSGDADKNI